MSTAYSLIDDTFLTPLTSMEIVSNLCPLSFRDYFPSM